MSTVFTFAHLSDVHLSPVAGFTPRYWNLKRALGFANWQRRRKTVHTRAIADRLVADAWAQGAEHVAITGDLINLGLPVEYENARDWLETVGPPERVTVIPGNHDIYTKLKRHEGVGRWAEWMDAAGKTPAFPFVKQAGPIGFVGLNSAVPRRPFLAAGKLGSKQIGAAVAAIAGARAAGLIPVVLIHHPPLPGLATVRRGLEDAFDFALMLGAEQPDLVLHGHNHTDTLVWHRSGRGVVPVVGVAAASAARAHHDEPLARYNLLHIAQTPGGLEIHRVSRGLAEPDGDIVEISRDWLTPRSRGRRRAPHPQL